MALATVSLDDKYELESGRIFLTGTQALVRLPMMQRQRDRAAGLNTAAYVTGYRGSPLGGLDQQMTRSKRFLEKNDIIFRPGVNEDLAECISLAHDIGHSPFGHVGEEALDIETIERVSAVTGGQDFQVLDREELRAAYRAIAELEPELYETISFRPRQSLHWVPVGVAVCPYLLYHSLGLWRTRRRGRIFRAT